MSVKSKRHLEGYLMIDHRASPGLPDALVIAQGMPPGSGRGLYEGATFTCSHCQRLVMLNSLRTRERAYCRGCDKYLCDGCGAERARTLECKTFAQRADDILIQLGV